MFWYSLSYLVVTILSREVAVKKRITVVSDFQTFQISIDIR